MGFHLRKSFKCGPLRFNLSNSGLGVSAGVKGLRVGIDGKGRGYIGGGKGMLRYRQYLNVHGKQSDVKQNFIHPEIPSEIKDYWFLSVTLLILLSPFYLLWLVSFFMIFDKSVGCDPFVFISFICVPPLFLLHASKRNRYINSGLKLYKAGKLDEALNILVESKRYKLKTYEAKTFLNDSIYQIYIDMNNFAKALDFGNSEVYVTNWRVKKITCLSQLDRWVEVIECLQNDYSEEEKQEHPVYYSTLGSAFLAINKPEIALETMLQGPVRKRNMNTEMCAYRYQLGLCYEAVNDKANALKQYHKIYSYDVNWEDVKERIEKLEK